MLRAAAGTLLGPISRHLTGGRPRVLFYHRFGDTHPRAMSPRLFAQQLAYLKRHFQPMRLSDLVQRRLAGEPLPARAVAVTVDDGYRDFAEFAYPELVRHEIPATLYAVSGFAAGRLWLWFDRLRYVCERSRRNAVPLMLAEGPVTIALASGADREAAWDQLATRCLRLAPGPREALIAEFARSAEVAVPGQAPSTFAALDATGLRQLDPALVEIGAHTETHPILSTCTDAELTAEIVQSRHELEAMLARPVPAFCYPNGRPEDFDERCVAAVAAAGYTSATVSTGMFVGPDSDLLRLPRLGAAGQLREFRHEIDGLTFLQARVSGRGSDATHGEIAGRAASYAAA